MGKVELWIWRVVLVGLIIFQFAVYFNVEANRKIIGELSRITSGLAEFNAWQLDNDK